LIVSDVLTRNTEKVDTMNTLALALADRIAIEREELTLNDNKLKTFERLNKSATDVIANTFDKYSVDMSFVASRRRKTAMLNVYAVDRTIDLAAFMSGNVALNHFTMHIVKSLANLNKNNIEVLTYSAARVACTALKDEVAKVEKDVVKHLSRVSKAIALSTVNTQCTITLDALRIMNVLEVTSTSSGEKAFKFKSSDARDAMIAQMTKHNML
jgi:hypothetical protein